MARSSSVTEAEVDISCFTSSLPGFRDVLEHWYSDFIVHEVARDGFVVRLTSLDLPDQCMDAKEDKKVAPAADADHSKALELFSGLCGEADCRALMGFWGRSQPAVRVNCRRLCSRPMPTRLID
ncbi:hypothetical protein ZWY2020_016598 [Hordeum vulgare]|nr:hypothetical protein ZWY2020_016598 [Hordeum vulgare]